MSAVTNNTLFDVEAIRQLKARYFRSMDMKDWDVLAACFTEDLETLTNIESIFLDSNKR